MILSFAILNPLFALSLVCAVVLDAAVRRTQLAVRGFAAKRTTKIIAAGITGMCQKEYPAMPTTSQAPPQAWLRPQYRPEHEIVLQHQVSDFAAAIPARPELKILLDFYDQKPSDSLMILMCLGMLRPTRSAHRVSRGRTKLFSAVLRLTLLLENKMWRGQFI